MTQTIIAGLAGGAKLTPQVNWAQLFGQGGSGQGNGAFDPSGNPAPAPNGVAPQGDFASVKEGGQSWNSPGTGLNAARNGSMLGGAAGLGLGVPGAGVVGAGIGSLMDTRAANDLLSEVYGIEGKPVDGWSAFANSLTHGLAGNSAFGQMSNAAGNAYSLGQGVFSDATFEANRAAQEQQNPTTPTAPVESVTTESLGSPGMNDTSQGSAPSTASDPTGSDAPAGSGFFNKGGHVTQERLFGNNPPGPDDGKAYLDVGEFVLRKDASRHYGPEILMALNEGRIPRQKLQMLLM
jgi:hypothetical protein